MLWQRCQMLIPSTFALRGFDPKSEVAWCCFKHLSSFGTSVAEHTKLGPSAASSAPKSSAT